MNTLILTLHILGAGFLLATLMILILFLRRKPFSKERLDSIRAAINLGAGAFIWMIITGSLLFSEKMQDLRANVLFWVKIGLFVIDLIFGLVLVNRKLKAVEKVGSSQIVSTSSLVGWTVFNLILTLIIIIVSIVIA